ncbi:acyltransferase [Intestinibacter bartlettii]|uniref:acyltransferase n=1 Tax=Intestinibacter bartlettii TaxID=261299 RepID=UPI00248B09C5|nr:acyltransferase family protein [Intestinibacter bartlettii]
MIKKRKTELDLLRILACIAVIVIHIPIALNTDACPKTSMVYQVYNVYNSLSRWCIPVFTMISGCFLLNNNKEITIKSIYFKNIFRIIKAFIFWSIIYALYNLRNDFEIKIFILKIMNGEWHMWYLFMITGLYIITPILREIIIKMDKKTLEYWLILMFIFSVVIPFIRLIPNIESITEYIMSKGNIPFLCGYTVYYILGYYLSTYDISDKLKKIIYIFGIIGAIFTIVGNAILPILFVNNEMGFNGYHCLNVFFMSIAIFIFFKNNVSKWKCIEKYSERIYKISSRTFGIYLIHVLIIEIIGNYNFIKVNGINEIIILPLLSIAVFIIGYIIIEVLSKIKYINKFIL